MRDLNACKYAFLIPALACALLCLVVLASAAKPYVIDTLDVRTVQTHLLTPFSYLALTFSAAAIGFLLWYFLAEIEEKFL